MKVAHLTTHLNTGGIPVYIHILAQALVQKNIEQIIISSGGSMEADFLAHKVPVFTFNLKTKSAFHPKIIFALPGVIRLLKTERVELIHAHTRIGQIMAACIEKITGIPFVSTCHGFYKSRLGRKLFPAWGQKVIAISEPVKNALITTHRISEKKIRRIRNGIELERFILASRPDIKSAARKKWLLKPEDFAICLVSRLISEKGVEDFLLAIQTLSRQHRNLRAFIVGDGPDKQDFERKAFDFGIAQYVTFTGNLNDVSEILSACDAFVHPVRVSEGFGLSIAEAMAAKLPVIVTDQWALSLLLKDKNIGEIISKENPGQIAAILENWLQQPEKRMEMGRNAQAAAIEYFDIKRMAEEVLQVYQEVLAQNGRVH